VEISAIHARLASINIKRGNLITLDLLGLPAAQPREVLDRLPSPQFSTLALGLGGHRSRGNSAGPA
jgi:hypothetical protein